MNRLWYNISKYSTDNLSDYYSFVIYYNKYNKLEKEAIYPELVEVAKHLVVWLENNPEFKNKITNAEYDLLIWDDVSGRPITLLIKHIIDHFRKEKWLIWNIKSIFISNPEWEWDEYTINKIQRTINNNKNILICSEHINSWNKLNWIYNLINNKLDYIEPNINMIKPSIFVQKIYKNVISNLSDWLFELFTCETYDSGNATSNMPLVEKNNKKHWYTNIWLTKDEIYNKEYIWWIFSKRIQDFNSGNIYYYRLQIKLLAEYIIKNHLS